MNVNWMALEEWKSSFVLCYQNMEKETNLGRTREGERAEEMDVNIRSSNNNNNTLPRPNTPPSLPALGFEYIN